MSTIDNAEDRMTDRLGELVPPLSDRNVLIVGCGSVGSTMADQLVRHGVGNLTLVDPDVVDAPNLSRSVYRATDIGTPKVDALAAHLRAINHDAVCRTVDGTLSGLPVSELDDLTTDVDLAIVATDDPATQAAVSHRTYAAGTPAIFPALYRGARAGEIVMVVPGATPCWTCATGVSGAEHSPVDKDYGTGRLIGEVALGADILTVVAVAAKHAVGLLAGPSSPAGRQTLEAIARHSMLVVSTTPAWEWFPDTFGDTAGQYAPQSIWLSVAGSSDCPVCGERPVPPQMPLDATLIDGILDGSD